MDELLLADDEAMEIDPEYLPRRLLTDFSIYNSEVRGGGRGAAPASQLACRWGARQRGWATHAVSQTTHAHVRTHVHTTTRTLTRRA